MKVRLLLSLFLFATIFITVQSKNEVLPTWVTVAQPRASCVTNAQARPCPVTRAAALLTAADLPDGLQCPCPISNPGDGSGGIVGANGLPVNSNPDKDFFVDEVLVNGFDNPIGMSFTDNSNELFVATRQGLVWYVNLETMQKKIFVDLNGEVGLSGDRGLMDVVAHPNYRNVKQMLVMYTLDPTPGDGVEPDAEGAANQRLIRLADLGDGVLNPNFRITLFGEGEADGVPICFNTHALGSLNFGLDGSLFVTTGEGAHWNFDMGDWGQDALLRFDAQGQPIPSLDNECLARFGAEQDIGAFRSMVLYSLGGKILRLAPDSGDGICNGSLTGSGYPIKNPFCDGTAGTSVQSRIWAIGLRNPFRSTLRPLLPGEAYAGGPGVLYFGDVGQGGYEEINAVVQPAMNFGWPCWEGPLPSPLYRDSLYNRDLNTVFNAGCGGTPTIPGTCGNITTYARNPDGTIMTCAYIYKNVTTTLPFFYWNRYPQNDNAGYFSECAYTGQGVLGATTAGLAFYTGDKYPSKYKNALFALEFSNNWIKVIFTDGSDRYVSIQDFADLIYTIPTNGAKVTLSAGPDGNICYITMNGGEVRCFRYIATNIAPSFSPGAVDNTGNAPVDIHFHMDGTFDRENDMILYQWNFGDGQFSSEPNPVHTYSNGGRFNVTLSGVDKYGHASNATMTVITNNRRPKVRITSPVPTLPNRVYVYQNNETVFFSATVDDESEATCSYRWEIQFIHNNHIHTDVANIYTKTFSYAGSAIPTEGALERNNVKLILHITDAQGLSAQDAIFLSRSDWETAFGGNSAPVPSFTYNSGFSPLEVGQPVKFDAQATNDVNGDRIDYYWYFGDGYNSTTVTSTHTYGAAGVYTVRLEVIDNWGGFAYLEQQITVRARTAIQPYSTVLSGEIYESFYTQLGSVQNGAEIRYSLDGSEPTQCSSLYSGPSLYVPFYPNVNVTLKIRSFVQGYGPSDAVSYYFQMIEPPCYELGLGTIDVANTGSLFCLNTVTARPNGSVITIPFANPLTALYTTAPPATGYIDYYVRRLNGVLDTTRTEFTNTTNVWFFVDQGTSVGAVLKVGVSYDFTGDGTFDRFEVFENIGPDPVPDEFEEFTFDTIQRRFPLPSSITGTGYQALVNGTVRVQIWEGVHNNNNGTDPLRVRIGDTVVQNQKNQMSRVNIPYKSFEFQNFGPNPYVGGPTPTTGNCNAVFTTGSVTSGSVTTGVTTGAVAGGTTSSVTTGNEGSSSSSSSSSSSTVSTTTTTGDNDSISSAFLFSVNFFLVFVAFLF